MNKIKLQEFEAQEQTVDLTSELEEERRARIRAEQELKVINIMGFSFELIKLSLVNLIYNVIVFLIQNL